MRTSSGKKIKTAMEMKDISKNHNEYRQKIDEILEAIGNGMEDEAQKGGTYIKYQIESRYVDDISAVLKAFVIASKRRIRLIEEIYKNRYPHY